MFLNRKPVLFLVGAKEDKPKAVDNERIKEFCVNNKIMYLKNAKTCGLHSMGSQRLGYNLATDTHRWEK